MIGSNALLNLFIVYFLKLFLSQIQLNWQQILKDPFSQSTKQIHLTKSLFSFPRWIVSWSFSKQIYFVVFIKYSYQHIFNKSQFTLQIQTSYFTCEQWILAFKLSLFNFLTSACFHQILNANFWNLLLFK